VRPAGLIADGVRSYVRTSLNLRLKAYAEVLFVGWVELAKPMRLR
jgi:2-polyprenyl-6-methoxyphenol hydroxylase-like FAD-dependent oxidoreductase